MAVTETKGRLGTKTLSPIMTADKLQVDLVPFRDEVQNIIRRGKMVTDLMRSEGAEPSRLQREEDAITKELLDCRMKVSYVFQETLSLIVSQNRA